MLATFPAYSQNKVTIDSATKTTMTIVPAAILDDLCEVVVIEGKEQFPQYWMNKVYNCSQFRQFKKDFPFFKIPKIVLGKFKDCYIKRRVLKPSHLRKNNQTPIK